MRAFGVITVATSCYFRLKRTELIKWHHSYVTLTQVDLVSLVMKTSVFGPHKLERNARWPRRLDQIVVRVRMDSHVCGRRNRRTDGRT